MNRRSLLRAIGLTAALVGTGGWLRAASAQPAPPVYRPSGPNRVPGGPPYPDRPGFAPPAARHGTTAARPRHGRTAIYGRTVIGAGSAAAIYGYPAAGSQGAPDAGGCPATGAARDRRGSTSTVRGDRQAPGPADGRPGAGRRGRIRAVRPRHHGAWQASPRILPPTPIPAPKPVPRYPVTHLDHRHARRSAAHHPVSTGSCRTRRAPCGGRLPLRSPPRMPL